MSVWYKAIRVSDSALATEREGSLALLRLVRKRLVESVPEGEKPIRFAVMPTLEGNVLEIRVFAGREARKYAQRNRVARRNGLLL